MKAKPKYHENFAPYVVIPDLPVEQQEPLRHWLIGQTMETIEAENENKYNCCFYSDYSNWYEHWIIGKTAPNYD